MRLRKSGVPPTSILDTFGAKKVGEHRVAVMIRVASAKATESCAELLVHRLGLASRDHGSLTSWVTRPRSGLRCHIRFNWPTCLERVRKQAGNDHVALGTHQLGIRLSPGDPRLVLNSRGVEAHRC